MRNRSTPWQSESTGNLSDNALLDAKNTLNTAKRDVTAAEMELYTAYHSYEQAVKQGLVSSAG